jgi:hypothetical protein
MNTHSVIRHFMNDPEIRMIKIRDQDGAYETVAAEQVSDDTYKLLETPALSCRINYGTTIQVQPDEKGELEMVKIVRASDYKTRRFILPSLSRAEIVEKLGNPISQAGGLWEVVFGGVIFIHMPRGSQFDLEALFRNVGSVTEIVDDKTGV